MRQLWIGTGWKMNHLMQDALLYADRLKDFTTAEKPQSNVFICVPFTVLYPISNKLKGSPVFVAAQNTHWLDRGAATGEISPLMIKDAGASMIEIGHSERRSTFAETDLMVNAKVKATLNHGMHPLVCVGETTQEKETGVTMERVAQEIKIAFHGIKPDQARKILLAYEPVWAIGESGLPATPEYANDIHFQIKQILDDLFGEEISCSIPVLYGGSVNQENALPLISMPNIDGLFIGRAAWKVEGFISIISMVERYIRENRPILA